MLCRSHLLPLQANAIAGSCACACMGLARPCLSKQGRTFCCCRWDSSLTSWATLRCRIGHFYNPELDLAQRREAKLEAKSLSVFGSTNGASKPVGKGKVEAKEVPVDTV